MTEFRWSVWCVFIAFTCIGCAPTRKAKQPDPVALMEKVTQLSAASRTTALVSYAFLYPEKAPTRFAAKRTAMQHKEAWARLGPFTEFVSRPVATGLPIGLEALKGGLPAAMVAEFLKTQSVLLARYYGPKLSRDAHVIEFARLARASAESPSFIMDLSTRAIHAVHDFDLNLSTPSTFLSEQVIPGVERADNGTITFYTRGMVKFGLPDLEQTEIQPKNAKQAFSAFQQILLTALEQPELPIGGQFEQFTLAECKRPKNAIEKNCVNLSSSTASKREN